jgi:pseudaminic acid biosynthesis-associated methylase
MRSIIHMKMIPQRQFWKGNFGKDYLKRNLFTPAQLNKNYNTMFGVTRGAMNKEFLDSLPRNIRILEVGANYGMQLQSLQKMGFTNLYGVELNPSVADFGRKRVRGINLIEGDALNLPFRDCYFDLVFTSGVLIHIAPKDRAKAMKEIYRCSNKYIWGFEYFAKKSQEIVYRGNKDRLWKTNFPALFQKQFPKLKLVKQRLYNYKGETNEDVMYLFKK